MTEEDIHACYRLLFGRQPDAEGWRTFHAMVGTTPFKTLVQALLFSPEFQQTDLYRDLVNEVTIPPAQLVELAGYVQYVRPDDNAISEQIARDRQYEPHVTKVFSEYLRPGMTFVDVGANVGFFALLAAHLVGTQGHVFAIEPSPINCLTLAKSVQANGWEHVRLYPLAAAARPTLFLYTPLVGSNGQIQPLDLAGEMMVRPRQVLVQGDSLDNLIPANIRPDLIKIDVEGAEHLVIQGAQQLLARCRPLIELEYTPASLEVISQIDGPGFLRAVQGLGYSFQGIQSDGTLLTFGNDVMALHNWCKQEVSGHVDILAVPDNQTKTTRPSWWGRGKR